MPFGRPEIFIVNFENVSYFIPVFLFVNFQRVNAGWDP